MKPPLLRSVPAPEAAVFGRRNSVAVWTGEKRRKTNHAADGTCSLEEQRGQALKEFVFSAQDDLTRDELVRCHEMLGPRDCTIYLPWAPRLQGKALQELEDRFCRLRFSEYKLLKEGDGQSWGEVVTDTVPVSDYPEEVWRWRNPYKPGLVSARGLFDWTIDPNYFDLAELDDYRRILPLNVHIDDYLVWEDYRLTFSSYKIDKEYVKYWDELPKKIKWIEEYMHLDFEEFEIYRQIGDGQALMIAVGFNHLPASLATRAYDEYLYTLKFDLECRKGFDHLYFEVWKRVFKQEMSFQEALKDIISSEKLPAPLFSRIESAINGDDSLLYQFNICMRHVQELVVGDDEGAVLKHITDAVYTKIERAKLYVDFVKKKLEVARRIHVLHGINMAG